MRIAMFSPLAPTLVPAILTAVADGALPVRSVSMLRGITAYSGRELLQREVDVVITSNALYDLQGLERHELIAERFILAVPRAWRQEDASLRALAAGLPLVRYSPRTEAGRLIEAHLRRQRLRIPNVYAFDSPEDLLAAVELGHGWAITAPTHALYALVDGSSVRLLPLPRPEIGRDITLVARAGELGELPGRLAGICRGALLGTYVPRAERLLGPLADCLLVAGRP